MFRAHLKTLSAMFAVSASLVACGGEPEAEPDSTSRPSILVLTIDTVRVDALGCYGGTNTVSPNIDQLAAEGVRYDKARATSPLTLPSHTSMFTGLYPPRHSVRDNSVLALSQAAQTTAEHAKQAGYSTAAFVAAVVLDSSYGLTQGFDTYSEPARPVRIQRSRTGFFAERPADEVADEVCAWLDERPTDRPFFCWAHFYDAHQPYTPAERYQELSPQNAYFAEVAAVDDAIGRIVGKLRAEGTLDDTLIAVVADHGEDFDQHGEATHGLLIFDTTMRVPFIVRYPRTPFGDGIHIDQTQPGLVVTEPVSIADLHPTLVQSMGVALADSSIGPIDGTSLLAPLDPERGVYIESLGGFFNYGWRPLAGWAGAQHKTIFGAREQLYDTIEDPGETVNLWTSSLPTPKEHRKQVGAVLARRSLEPDLEAVGADKLAQLSQLGYAAAGFVPDEIPSPLEEVELPDPHDSLPEFDLVQRGLDLLRQGQTDSAAILLDSVVQNNPRNYKAMQNLASVLITAQRFEDARYWLVEMQKAGCARPTDIASLGFAEEKLGRNQDAEEHYREALALHPTNLTAVRGLVRLTKDDPEKASEHVALKARARELRGLEPEE